MRRISIGIIEEKCSKTDKLKAFFERDDRFRVSFLLSTSTEAYEKILEALPDILILNYEIPGVRGTSLLDMIGSIDRSSRPYVILTTAIQSSIFMSYAAKHGASDIVIKPFSTNDIIERVSYLYSYLNNENIHETDSLTTEDTFNRKVCEGCFDNNRITARKNELRLITGAMYDILLASNIPISSCGFTYIIEAVKRLYFHDSYEQPSMKALYPVIAESFNSRAKTVEKCIRTAIGVGWSRSEYSNSSDMKNVFNKYSIRPSNREVLIYMTAYVKKMIKQDLNTRYGL